MSEINMCQGLEYKLKPGVPRISDMSAQKVISVEVVGDPNQETARLMTPLYATALQRHMVLGKYIKQMVMFSK